MLGQWKKMPRIFNMKTRARRFGLSIGIFSLVAVSIGVSWLASTKSPGSGGTAEYEQMMAEVMQLEQRGFFCSAGELRLIDSALSHSKEHSVWSLIR